MKPTKTTRAGAALLSALLMLSLAACGGQDAPEEETPDPGVAVQVQTVTSDTIATENKVSGKISADNEYTILIASAAKCTAVYAEAGDEVQAGDVLCTLDLGSALSSYNAARIGYNSAVQSYNDQKAVLDKQVQLALDNVNNTKALLEIGAASQLEADQAEGQTTEETEPEDVPEPYVIVRIPGGELPDQDTRQQVEAILVVCVCDPDPGRQGFRDALHIVNTILTHYGENGIVGRRYEVQYPIKWVTQEEDTHPYYFAGMALTFAAPAIFKEVPET